MEAGLAELLEWMYVWKDFESVRSLVRVETGVEERLLGVEATQEQNSDLEPWRGMSGCMFSSFADA